MGLDRTHSSRIPFPYDSKISPPRIFILKWHVILHGFYYLMEVIMSHTVTVKHNGIVKQWGYFLEYTLPPFSEIIHYYTVVYYMYVYYLS